MAKAYTFKELMAKNKKIANTPLSELYKPNGDEATEILDIPSLSRDQAAAQASAAAAAQAAKQSEALYTGWKRNLSTVPAKSYTDWLKAGGMNGQAKKDYDAAVRAAETDYAKTLALYGQNAETLGRAGLTGSGYGDYLKGVGFSAMQGAKIAAADTKALTEAQQRMAYAQYLSGVEAQNAELMAQENAKQEALAAEQEATAANIKSTIDTAIQQGMDDKAIMAMIQQHYGNDFDSYLSGWIANAHTYNDPLVAQSTQSAADAEAAKYREEIFNQLKAGVDPAIVRSDIEYVMKFTGADTSQLDTWMAEAQTAAQPTVDALNAEKTKADRSAALQAYSTMISGGLDKATALDQLKQDYSDDIVDYVVQIYDTSQANIKSDAQDATFKKYSDALDLKGLTLDQIGTADQYHNLAVAGQITPEQARLLTNKSVDKRFDWLADQFKNIGDIDEENAAGALAEWRAAVDAFSAEDLPDFQRAQLYGMLGDALLSGNIELKKPVSEMLNDIRELDKTKIGEAAYNGVVDAFLDAVEIPDTADYVLSSMPGGFEYALKINLGKRADGKESVQEVAFQMSGKEPTEAIQKVLGKPAQNQEIRALNGNLYIYSNSKWYAIASVKNASAGGKENADLMYDLLVRYYSSSKVQGDNYRGQDLPAEKHKNVRK